MSNFFRRITYPQKFVLITLLFILPLVSFLPVIIELNADLDHYGHKELQGTLYLRPLQQLLEDVQSHQLIVKEFLEGQAGEDELVKSQASVDNDFIAVQNVHQLYGQSLQLSINPNDLQKQWQEIRNGDKTTSLHESAIKHDLFSKAIRGVISIVGDKSFLVLDPDLDTYYMVDAVLLKAPNLQNKLTQALIQGEKAVDNTASFTAADRVQLLILVGELRNTLNETQQNVTVALNNNKVGSSENAPGAMSALVKAPLDTEVSTLTDFASLIETRILNAQTISMDEDEFAERANKALSANAAFYDATSQALEVGVRARIDRNTYQLVFALTTSVLGIVVAFVLGLLLMLAISRPLSNLNQAAQRLASGDLSARIAVTSQDEVGQVSMAFNLMAEELKETLAGLEQRGAELGRRSSQLESAALVTQAAAENRDLKELLENVVNQITQRFNFYHAGIFLADVNEQFVILQAASSEGGKKMIERGHRLEIGRQGIVGYAAYQKRPRIAQDVGADAVFFNNPDLPETHSEVALPLIAQNRLIGILDIQSQERNAFTDEDIHTLQTMADQIALAIDNTRLFDESRSAIQELQILTSESTLRLWKERLGQQSKGYVYSSLGVLPLSPEESATSAEPQSGEHVIKFPIALRGQQIGVLALKRKSSESTWTEAEQEMASKIAGQVALAIENARLLEDSQRRAEKESTISNITAKIRKTNDPNEMISVAISELKHALNIKDVRIIPYNPPENGDRH